jgi:hypothetical protein
MVGKLQIDMEHFKKELGFQITLLKENKSEIGQRNLLKAK